MFEKASRLRLRFNGVAPGKLTVEDLWRLPLSGKGVCLDSVAKALNKQLKDTEEESFVVKKSAVDEETTLKFNIVKRIIEVRLAEAEAAKEKREKSEKRQKILGILADKEDEDLKGKSVDELKALL